MIRDQHANDRDELAVKRLERDRHREPRATGIIRYIKPAPRVTQGARFMLSVDSSSVRLDCPRCLGPVYAAGDSAGEQLDCAICDARLVTRRDLGGDIQLELDEGIAR